MSICPNFLCTDSVTEGEKLVKTAIDNFGRIGISLLTKDLLWVTVVLIFCLHRYSDQQCWVRSKLSIHIYNSIIWTWFFLVVY